MTVALQQIENSKKLQPLTAYSMHCIPGNVLIILLSAILSLGRDLVQKITATSLLV
jgi:hypothetical protein